MALSAGSATPTITTASFTSSPTVAVPNLTAFTTPFAQPTSCVASSLLTTTVTTYSGYGTTTSRTLVLPDKSDPRYTACLDPASGHFSFSPAVCPQGWVAWWLGRTTIWTTATSASLNLTLSGAAAATATKLSTAYCCPQSFSVENLGDNDIPSPSCSHAFETTTPSGVSLVKTITLSEALVPAWHISWQSTDVPTLSPQPPELGNERFVQWTPGSDPQREPRDGWAGGKFSPALYFFLVAGVPILIVAAVCACMAPICRSRARASRARRVANAPPRSRAGGGGVAESVAVN